MQSLRIRLIRVLNECAERYLGPPHSTDKTTLIIKVRKKAMIRIDGGELSLNMSECTSVKCLVTSVSVHEIEPNIVTYSLT